jgi:hypothetical protein
MVTFTAEARRELCKVEAWLFSEKALESPVHVVEEEQFRRMREVSRLLYEAHIRARGRGDVGPSIEVEDGDGDVVVHSHRRPQPCNQSSVFGDIKIERTGYAHPGRPSVRPIDPQLQLPERSFSYEVQRRVILRAVQGPFNEAVESINDLTGLNVSNKSAEDIVLDAAVDFENFYKAFTPTTEETGPIVVGAVDGKGVPMVKQDQAEVVVRRGRGKKANKKRMATVAAVYTIQPRIRTPEEVTESLFRPDLKVVGGSEPKRPPRPGPEQKRIWASLERGKDAVIQEVQEEMLARDPTASKCHVAVTDGERALQKRVRKYIPDAQLILDLLHVLEKLWVVTHIFFDEGSQDAVDWVREHALSILQGKVSQVVKGIRSSATKRKILGDKREIIDKIAGYLYRNKAYMRYDEYLAKGLPIASGAVEGACKYLVKDRMERAGMRWRIVSAEAMLKLRATYLSGDFDEYWTFHIAEEQERLLPGRQWGQVTASP